MRNWGWNVYTVLQRRALGPLVSRLFFEGKRPLRGALGSGGGRVGDLVWFHAASAGELESLWSVIQSWVAQGGDAIVSILSKSAEERLPKLRQAVEGQPGRLIAAGYSPWEGYWGEALATHKPKLFVTAKYEAWPELWSELGKQSIPLLVVGARARRSFRVAANFMRSVSQKLPKLHLCTAIEDDLSGLRDIFPQARIVFTGEPRWDRVKQRAQSGSERSIQLIEVCRELPRPWGILGSAWVSDLEKWDLAWPHLQGTVWVVPHDIGEDEVNEVEEHLAEGGLRPIRSSLLPKHQNVLSNCVLVNEMGFLSELYSAADWAFIGGGFGKGVHSTIEPAIQGIPVAMGPKNADRFPEIMDLERSGQLKIIANEGELRDWLLEIQGRSQAVLSDQRSSWVAASLKRFGATDRVISEIRKAL